MLPPGLDLPALTLDELRALNDAVQKELTIRNCTARCGACRGVGMLDDGSYCFCRMGRDLQKVEKGLLSL